MPIDYVGQNGDTYFYNEILFCGVNNNIHLVAQGFYI